MKSIALSKAKGDLAGVLRKAEKEQVVLTRRGKPVGVLIGFASEDDWFDYCLENSPALVRRTAEGRRELRAGKGIRLEDIDV